MVGLIATLFSLLEVKNRPTQVPASLDLARFELGSTCLADNLLPSFQQKFEAKDGDLHLNLADKFRTKSSNKDIESVKCYCTGQENAPFCKKA